MRAPARSHPAAPTRSARRGRRTAATTTSPARICEPSNNGGRGQLRALAVELRQSQARRAVEVTRRGRPQRRQRRVLDDAGAVGVGERDAARPGGEQQAGDPDRARRADRARLERIDVGILEPAVDDVDRFEPVERAQPHAPLSHDQVGALDEVDAELHGEVRVVDVRRVIDAAREQRRCAGSTPATRRRAPGAAAPGSGRARRCRSSTSSSADVRDITDRSSSAYPMPGGASVRSWTTCHTPSAARTMSTAYVVSQRAGCVRADRRQPVAVARVRAASAGTMPSRTSCRAPYRSARTLLERVHPLDHGRRQPLERRGVDARPGSGRAATGGWRSSPPGRRPAPAGRARGARRRRRRAAGRPAACHVGRAVRRRAAPCAARRPTSAIRRNRRRTRVPGRCRAADTRSGPDCEEAFGRSPGRARRSRAAPRPSRRRAGRRRGRAASARHAASPSSVEHREHRVRRRAGSSAPTRISSRQLCTDRGNCDVEQQEPHDGRAVDRPAGRALVHLQRRQRAQHAHPLHLVVVVGSIAVDLHLQQSDAARTPSTRVVMSARSMSPAEAQHPYGARRGSSSTSSTPSRRRLSSIDAGEEAVAGAAVDGPVAPRRARTGTASLSACQASRGITSRVVRRFSRASATQLAMLPGLSRSATRNSSTSAARRS